MVMFVLPLGIFPKCRWCTFALRPPVSFGFCKLCFVNSKGAMSYMFLGQQDPRSTMVVSILCFVQHKNCTWCKLCSPFKFLAPIALSSFQLQCIVVLFILFFQVLFHVI